MATTDRWFGGGGPDYASSDAARIEDQACRAALRTRAVSPAAVLREFSLPPSGRLTFAHLCAACDFPRTPAVTDLPPDSVDVLVGRFRKSRLAAAWVHVWDSRPEVRPGHRALVLRGGVWGLIVAYDGKSPDRPHVCVGHGVLTRPLVVEPLSAWVRSLDWLVGSAADPDGDDG